MSYSKKIIMYTVFQKVMTFLWAGSSLPGIHIEITLGIAEEFFDYNSPNLNGFGRNLEYKCGNTVRTRVFLRGNRPRGFTKRRQTCFVFFSATNTTTPFGRVFCNRHGTGSHFVTQ